VRGDSLRDFYAKSLALLGLAALAGIGALVDYWPADLGMPRDVARALPMPAVPAPAPAVDLVLDLTTPSVPRASRPVLAEIPRSIPTVAATSSAIPFGAVELVMSAPAPASIAVALASEVPATEIALSAPLPPSIPVAEPEPAGVLARTVALREPAAASVAPVDSSPAQVVTGALRWTGQSILNVGAKTGATIVDALGAFKGAFRKVPWFSSAPASRPIG
jgi:hypothetical protein